MVLLEEGLWAVSALVLFVRIVGLEVVLVLGGGREGSVTLATLVVTDRVDRFDVSPEVDLAPEGMLT